MNTKNLSKVVIDELFEKADHLSSRNTADPHRCLEHADGGDAIAGHAPIGQTVMTRLFSWGGGYHGNRKGN